MSAATGSTSKDAGSTDPLATAVALAAVALWSASPLATKLAVTQIDPVATATLRTLIAALAALPLIVLGRRRLPRSREGRRYLAVSSMGGFFLFPLLFSIGAKMTSAGHAVLILGMLPVFTGLIAAVLERRVPGGRWWAGCVLALIGTAVLTGARFGLTGGGTSALIGDLLILLSAVAAAAGYVAGARAARETGSWAITLWGIVLGGLVFLPVVPFLGPWADYAAAGAVAWGAVLYTAIVSSIIGYVAWYWALGRGGIGRTGLTQFLQPLLGLVLAVAILDEVVTWPMTVAAVAILGGVAWARRPA